MSTSLRQERLETAQMAQEVAREAAEMTIRQLAGEQGMRLAMPPHIQVEDLDEELEPE